MFFNDKNDVSDSDSDDDRRRKRRRRQKEINIELPNEILVFENPDKINHEAYSPERYQISNSV